MVCLVAAVALVLAQAVPPPVRVPGHINLRAAERAPASITLFDGFDAYERLVDAFASTDDAARVDPRVHARADRALDDWQRGERRAAVEAWARLALELEGATGELDLLAAAMRLECVEKGHVTRIRRGCYSFGSQTRTTQLRVRTLFPVLELAAHCFDIELQASGRTLDRIRALNVPAAAFGPFPTSKPDTDTIESMAPIALRGAHRAMWSRFALGVEAASLERSCEFLCGAAEPVRARARQSRWQAEDDSGTREGGRFAALASEDEVLRNGRSPYADRAWTTEMGPFWRTHAHGKLDVPAWTLIPEARGDGALPVVVVLHEKGFDEGWAVRLAGGGALFEEADRRGVAVLAPPIAALEEDPTSFAALIESLAMDARIDRARVHVLAPASAAPLARRLAEVYPTLVASVIVLGEEDRARAESPAGVGRVLGLERPIAQALDSIDRAGGR